MDTSLNITISTSELFSIIERFQKLKEDLRNKLAETEELTCLLEKAIESEAGTAVLMELRSKSEEYLFWLQKVDSLTQHLSDDRARVTAIIQGMKKARPELDVFMDVDKLHSGDEWEYVLKKEIIARDIFYLCWSHAAKVSRYVEME